mmetsp:Transcript_13037/g.30849  ORF Transcript_13037/g.30849 Transcript_13037/m.30849 type:complete len:350 (-) Transcript_13037:2-1051(-)
MDYSKIPPKMRLLDVTARNDDKDGMVISGKLQLDSSISRALESNELRLKLHVEAKEKETVQKVFATDIGQMFYILFHGKHSYSKSHEGRLLQKEYFVGDDQIENQGGQDLAISVPLGKESQSWKPRRSGKVQHCQGFYDRREGEFEVIYSVKASITKVPSGYNETSDVCHWSNAVELQFASSVLGDKTPQHDVLRVDVGAPVMIPQTKFFGLLEEPPNRFFTLIPSEKKIQLCPNQQLTILLCQNPNDKEALVVDLEKVHVKFTQRNVCNGESFDRHWERKLLPSQVNDTKPHTLQGTVLVPGFWTPSYDGSIVQVVNEMIIYITQHGKQAKDMLAISPKIIVQLKNNR